MIFLKSNVSVAHDYRSEILRFDIIVLFCAVISVVNRAGTDGCLVGNTQRYCYSSESCH